MRNRFYSFYVTTIKLNGKHNAYRRGDVYVRSTGTSMHLSYCMQSVELSMWIIRSLQFVCQLIQFFQTLLPMFELVGKEFSVETESKEYGYQENWNEYDS